MATTALVATVAGGMSAQLPSAPVAPVASPASVIRVTPENARLTNYLHDLAGPTTLVGVFGGGLVDHLRRTRGQDSEDLASDIASRAGRVAVEASVRHGLAAVMHHSTGYQFCECRGFGPRVEHALLETFTDRRADGTRAIAVPSLAGAYAGSFAALAWQRDRAVSDAALGATVSIGFSALFNIARELTGLGR